MNVSSSRVAAPKCSKEKGVACLLGVRLLKRWTLLGVASLGGLVHPRSWVPDVPTGRRSWNPLRPSITRQPGTHSEPSRSDSDASLRGTAECRAAGCRKEELHLQ